MYKNPFLIRHLMWLCLGVIGPMTLGAQSGPEVATRALATIPEVNFRNYANTGMVTFVRMAPLQLAGGDLREKVATFMHAFGAAWGYEGPDHTLLYRTEQSDVAGGHHLHFEQWWRGLPTVGGELRFHFDGLDRLTAVNGLLLPTEPLSLTATLTVPRAIALAQPYFQRKHKSGASPALTAEPHLVLFRSGLLRGEPGRNHLAYAISLRDDSGYAATLYLDAHSGRILEEHPTTFAVLDRRLYRNAANNQGGNLLWSEGDPFPGSLNETRQEILTVTGQFYHFLRYTFGRDSYDGSGATLRSVHNPISIDCSGSPNANWNGTSINLCNSLVTDDVIAHEWGHALTQLTSNQVYQYQPGALNESFSDILGEVVDLINLYGDDAASGTLRGNCGDTGTRWRIAEENTAFPPYLRDMWDPTCKADPGKTSDPEYDCTTSDNGGVHTNSGVNNHAFALLVDGGTYNGQTIAAIGLTKATHLFYLAHTTYLTRYAGFADQADALEAAATQLAQAGTDLPALTIGETSTASGEVFSATDVAAVSAAITAVELRVDPSCPAWEPLFATAPPEPCSGAPPAVLFGEDFETGATGWTTAELPENAGTWDARSWSLASDLPNGRTGQAYYGTTPYILGDCGTDLDNGIIRLISPAISFPAGAAAEAVLSFDHSVSLEDNYDGGRLSYSVNEGSWTAVPATAFSYNGYNGTLDIDVSSAANPYQGQPAFTGADEGGFTCAWGTTQLALDGLEIGAGDAVRFAWDLATDGCNGWFGWWIDNVTVTTCSAALPVEWLTFSASAERDHIELRWSTAQEENNLGFGVERLLAEPGSATAMDWTAIGWVPARKSGSTGAEYTFADHSAPSGRWCYYRLRQEDTDGSQQYSPIVKARRGGNRPRSWIYPNPVIGDYLWLSVDNGIALANKASIFSASGQLVLANVSWGESGRIDVRSLPPGVYFLRIEGSPANPVTLRFIR